MFFLCFLSSPRGLTSHVPPHPPRDTKSHVRNTTLPELLELIAHLMKNRKESAYLTSRHSALNTAIKLPYSERAPQHQGLCGHRYATLDKYQVKCSCKVTKFLSPASVFLEHCIAPISSRVLTTSLLHLSLPYRSF